MCVERRCELAHCPGVQRASGAQSVQVIDPWEEMLSGCLAVTYGMFVKVRVGGRNTVGSGRTECRGKNEGSKRKTNVLIVSTGTWS